jgi:hypothetical protein
MASARCDQQEALVVMLLGKGAKNDMGKLYFAHGGCQR